MSLTCEHEGCESEYTHLVTQYKHRAELQEADGQVCAACNCGWEGEPARAPLSLRARTNLLEEASRHTRSHDRDRGHYGKYQYQCQVDGGDMYIFDRDGLTESLWCVNGCLYVVEFMAGYDQQPMGSELPFTLDITGEPNIVDRKLCERHAKSLMRQPRTDGYRWQKEAQDTAIGLESKGR